MVWGKNCVWEIEVKENWKECNQEWGELHQDIAISPSTWSKHCSVTRSVTSRRRGEEGVADQLSRQGVIPEVSVTPYTWRCLKQGGVDCRVEESEPWEAPPWTKRELRPQNIGPCSSTPTWERNGKSRWLDAVVAGICSALDMNVQPKAITRLIRVTLLPSQNARKVFLPPVRPFSKTEQTWCWIDEWMSLEHVPGRTPWQMNQRQL